MNTRETMKGITHKQASHLLHNKFVLILGDSIQRSVYKDLVLLLQTDSYLQVAQLKSKGEYSFEQDCLVEGGRMNQMSNGVEYKEVRQYQSDHHLVRFYFLTRIYSRYMQSILEDLRKDLKPDIVIVNSCVWDISRYNPKWMDDYPENLHKFFAEITEILPKKTLFIWNLTMPLAKKIIGGFFVPEIHHMASHLRRDVIEANFYSGTLADAYGLDVLDLHFHFRFSLQHRMADGIHWDALAHRRISSLLLQHAASAWGVTLTSTTANLTDIDRRGQRTYDKTIKPCPSMGPNHPPWGVPAGPWHYNSPYMAGPGLRDPQLDRHRPVGPWRPSAPYNSRQWGGPVETWSEDAWGAQNNSGYPYPPPGNFFSYDTERHQQELEPYQPREYRGHSHEFCDDSVATDNTLANGYLSFEDDVQPREPKRDRHYRRPLSPRRDTWGLERDRFDDRLPPPRPDHHHHHYYPVTPCAPRWQEDSYVMRNRHTRRHAVPYTVHRPRQHYHHRY